MTDHRLATRYCRLKSEGVRLQLVASNDVIGQLLAHAVELELGRFVAPELQAIEREDPEMARRIGEAF